MNAKVLNFPSTKPDPNTESIYSVLSDLADYNAPLARAHSARLYLSGVLTERQYETALSEIDGGAA
jgi:hypothetical protein